MGALRTRDHPPNGRPPAGCRPRSVAHGWRPCCGSGRDRANASFRAAVGSNARSADGETCWRQTLSATAYTGHDRSIHGRSASPRHRETPAAATGRSAAVTNRRPACRRPHHVAPGWSRACLVSGAAPARTPPRRRPMPGRRRGHHCGQSPAIPSTTVGRSAARSPVPTGRPRSRVRSPHAQPGSVDWLCAAAGSAGSRPIDAGIAGSGAASHPACVPSRGSHHRAATLPRSDPAVRR